MAIESIDRLNPVGTLRDVTRVTSPQGSQTSDISFKQIVKKAISEVNNLQKEADELAVKLATGDIEDVHRAMIAMQKAKLALDLTIQVRNKVIEAYQEVMRMQV
ncbi:MAG: flagellar hook-basal body complex protein FliE [Armatimonadota bacterium]